MLDVPRDRQRSGQGTKPTERALEGRVFQIYLGGRFPAPPGGSETPPPSQQPVVLRFRLHLSG